MSDAIQNLPSRITFVDDEQDIREIFRHTLEEAGYEGALATCGSGEELLNRIRVLQPELILLDLKMPDMDGPAILEKLQYEEPVPVVFVTGAIKLEMIEHYKPLGVIGVLHKPLRLETLAEDIAALWESHTEKAEATA